MPATRPSSGLQKAYLELREPQSGGGVGGAIKRITFQFNPKEYTLQKSAKWNAQPARGAREASLPEYEGPEQQTMSIEMFLDKTGSSGAPGRDIVKEVEQLFECCTPLASTVSGDRPTPPFVVFGWGTTVLLTAVVKQVSAKFTLFDQNGTPLRAVCTVQLQEIAGNPARQNPTSGGLAPLRSHLVVAGDSLASIAAAEYRDPGLWRAIAEANGIDDPMAVHTGTTLLLPTQDEARAAEGHDTAGGGEG